MKEEWFTDVIKHWNAEIQWTETELTQISKELMEIARLNKGTIFDDKQIDEEIKKNYVLERTRMILDALVRTYVTKLPNITRCYYYKKSNAFQVDLPFLEPMKYEEKININTASEGELEALPGIGRVTAKRIIDYRNELGLFEKLEDVKNVKGIGTNEFSKFKYALYAGKPFTDFSITSPILFDMYENPSFDNYVTVLKDHNINLTKYSSSSDLSLKERIIAEVSSLREEIERKQYNPFMIIPGIRSSVVEEEYAISKEAERISGLAINGNIHGSLVDDSKYIYFVLKVLKEAQKSIRIIMFFMRYELEDDYPTDKLFAELLSAKDRGVDIKIILDQDAEGSVKNSRIINKEAFKFFQDHDIPVRFDSVERSTHTKLVVADDNHIIIGSHNWTAGSFFAYDDTSVYINSADLADYYKNQFDELWGEYEIPN